MSLNPECKEQQKRLRECRSDDYLIINDDLDTCVQEMHNIIEGEHNRSFRNGNFMCQIKEELNGNLKGE